MKPTDELCRKRKFMKNLLSRSINLLDICRILSVIRFLLTIISRLWGEICHIRDGISDEFGLIYVKNIGQNRSFFCPLLVFQIWPKPTYFWPDQEKRCCIEPLCVKIGRFYGHLPGFCPLLKIGFDHEKCPIYGALRFFCPLSHFIFYLVVIKK